MKPAMIVASLLCEIGGRFLVSSGVGIDPPNLIAIKTTDLHLTRFRDAGMSQVTLQVLSKRFGFVLEGAGFDDTGFTTLRLLCQVFSEVLQQCRSFSDLCAVLGAATGWLGTRWSTQLHIRIQRPFNGFRKGADAIDPP